MRLISSRETVNFLSQAAPRPWAQRMLRWMIFDQELIAYFNEGRVQPFTSVMEIIGELVEGAGEISGPKMDAAIRKEFSPELAAKLIGKGLHERVDDDPFEWNEPDEPRAIDPGFFMYATEIDWEKGTLWAEWIPEYKERFEPLFPSDDMLGSEFEKAEFEVRFSGMSFEFNKIEMLLPNMEVHSSTLVVTDRVDRKRSIGRPPKWDWEGALAFIVSQAQLPDGLPTGPGAQARIEEMMANWFTGETGDAPAPSQIRQRAANIVRSLETSKKPERY